METVDQEVRDFLKADRQWFRAHRLAHAKQQLTHATTDFGQEFWTKVIEALS